MKQETETLLTVRPDFDREAWEEAPECRKCRVAMQLNVGCEWPDDDRALLCGACATTALVESLETIASTSAALEQAHREGAQMRDQIMLIVGTYMDTSSSQRQIEDVMRDAMKTKDSATLGAGYASPEEVKALQTYLGSLLARIHRECGVRLQSTERL